MKHKHLIYAAFVNMTKALPLPYAYFIITLPIHFLYKGGLKSQCKVRELAPLVRIDVIFS
jgi:hypothetical protein